MKSKNCISIIFGLMATLVVCSCSMGKGDLRDRNLERAMLEHLDTIPNIQYVGMSDVHDLDDGKVQAVVIYYVPDSVGNKVERNVRVTTNDDCRVIFTWEDLDSQVLGDIKKEATDKLEENGIDLDGSLIDALIELKKR